MLHVKTSAIFIFFDVIGIVRLITSSLSNKLEELVCILIKGFIIFFSCVTGVEDYTGIMKEYSM